MADRGAGLGDGEFEESILVSPPFSCGVGLLVDILLRLGVRVRPPDTTGWIETVGGFVPTAELRTDYTRHAACMAEQTVFSFPDRRSVVFEHRMDMAALSGRACILFVRDPVDSVFSWHRRWDFAAKGLSFGTYLDNFSVFPHHLPHGALVARPLEIFAVFTLFWLLAADDPVVVRYEDVKQDPVGAVAPVLAALGVERSAEAVADAARLSSFDAIRARNADQPAWGTTNRRSQVYEWRQRVTEAERGALTAREPLAALCRFLGYETAAGSGDGDVTEHASAFGIMFQGMLRSLRARFPSGTVAVTDYLDACAGLASSMSGKVRVTAVNDSSIDAGDLDAFTAVATTLKLLGQVFRSAGPQPVDRLERLVGGLSAVLANSAANDGFRHMPGDMGFFS